MRRAFVLLRSFCQWCQEVKLPCKQNELPEIRCSTASRGINMIMKMQISSNIKRNTNPFVPRKYTSKKTDAIRPISDKLLQSVAKRHADNVFVQASQIPSQTELSTLSSEELVHLIYNKNTETTGKQLRETEQLLTKRLHKMPLNLILQACHGFYIQQHNFQQFLSHVLSITEDIFDILAPSPEEITKLMLYVFIHGSGPSMLFHRVEDYLTQHLETFNINDLGVICIGFFRGNSRLTSQDLVDAIAGKLLKDISMLEPYLFVDFLKMFRHAGYIRVSFYERLADFIVENSVLSKFSSINPLMHFAFTFASLSIKHAPLFVALLTRMEILVGNQRNVRTKDLSKFVWACGTLQFLPENYVARYELLTRAFQAHSEHDGLYPESSAEMLMGLAYLGIFPEDMLDHCFSPDIASRLVGSTADKEKSIQLLLLHESVKVECPGYKGRTLTQSQVSEIMQHPSTRRNLETDLQRRVGLKAVLSSLQHSLGSDFVHCHFPLLQFKTPVIELQYSKEKGFLSFPAPAAGDATIPAPNNTFTQRTVSNDLLSALSSGSLFLYKAPSTAPSKRVAIVVSGSSQYALNSPTHMLGHLHTMKRQLPKLGYTVLEITPETAVELELSSHKERCQLLSSRLSKTLQDNIVLK